MEYDVVLLPSFAQVEAWRKRRAEERRPGLFACAVTTFDAWVADLWELQGDGREIVSGMQREVLLRALCDEAGGELATPGVAPLAASCVSRASGLAAFGAAVGGAVEGLSAREIAFFRVIAHYYERLQALGLVELGQAASVLAENAERVFPQGVRVLMPEAAPLTWVQRSFFETASGSGVELDVERAEGAQGIPRAPEGVDVRFAFPSGRLAEPGLVADLACEQGARGDVLVVCKDPIALGEQVSDRLIGEGMSVCVQASKAFSQTDFGRAFLAHYHCLSDDEWNPAFATDALYSPFSGVSRGDAVKFDVALRSDRIAERQAVLDELCYASEPFSRMQELASDPDADVLIGVFEQQAASSVGRSAAWRAEQLAAMSALRDATSSARRAGVGIDVCVAVLERASIPVSYRVAGDGESESGKTVVFTTQARACSAYSTLIVADLTAEDYPVSDKEDAASTLLSKLGLEREESAISRARRTFCALLSLPSERAVFVRPLGDANADETYPSIVLEEFVDAYRDDPSATDDIDNAFRLPDGLREGLVERGEEMLFANERTLSTGAEQRSDAMLDWPYIDDLDEATRARVPKRRRGEQGRELSVFSPSPSQIEVYLECPYKWFATRRLSIEEVDEGFGPIQRGSFAHAALETFYRRFQEAGHQKVSEGNLDEARVLMRSVLDELKAAQFGEEPVVSNRLVPIDELEKREVDQLCDQLVGYLDFEARLLPTFHPTYFEYKIDADHAIDYAGFPLVGTVDRIDVDDAGHAVIIDYKGSVGPEHEIGEKDAVHVGKVQTRVYAQAIKRALGLDVVGALYMSYGQRPALAGAYDVRVLESPHLPAMRHDHCACGMLDAAPDPAPEDFSLSDLTFSSMLDATEELAGEAIQAMSEGVIAPNPSSAKACAFCPVHACTKRMGA